LSNDEANDGWTRHGDIQFWGHSGDLVRRMVSLLYQALSDAEDLEVMQAERHERSLTPTT
jgi:hypothetical protein